MKGFVNKCTCIGCTICTSICSEIFEIDVDGLAMVRDIEAPHEIHDRLREAEESCPVNAISIK